MEVRIPLEGESELFNAKANTYSMNPPRAVIEKNEIVLLYNTPADQPRDIRVLVEQTLRDMKQHLSWQRSMTDAHNHSLPDAAEQAILQRAQALGIPIRRCDDAPKTFALPTLTRKAVPTPPPATTAQFKPAPALAMELYEHILKVVQDMALVMERSPDAFRSMNEEALRQHFLVQLNGQFEGKATGESFNTAGKTDILLREGDRNAFIAECKFWRGPKALGEATDQLLGYATWRDGKTAIPVFNRGTETSTVLADVDATAKAHAKFKRAVNWPHESGFRYFFHANANTNRELIMTVLAFHVPH